MTLLTIDEAQERILARVRPLAAEPVRLEHALGRVLAAPAAAAVDLPPFPSSAMDGFAIRSADVPGTLPVVERIAAGRPAARALAAGEAMGIATGGAVPDGADAVVPIELVAESDGAVAVAEAVSAGANVRPRGGDVQAGQVVVPAGQRLGPAQIGALAAAGIAEVSCAARPRVALVTTGSELRSPGERLGPGEIYEANGLILAAALERDGAVPEVVSTVADEDELHREALARGLQADVLVTSGGVSVGPHDLVRRIEAELGVEEVFWGVAVKPGKPLAFGVRERTLVFGLPGNPVSALVCFDLFVRPAVRALQGEAHPLPEFLPGRLARSVRRNEARDELVRARSRVEDDAVLVEPVTGQESHMIARAAAADVLALIPRGHGELAAGAAIRYLPLA